MPNNNAKVALEIYVDDKGTLRVREFVGKTKRGLEDVAKKSQSVTQRMQAGWEKLKGAWAEVLAGIYSVQQAWDLMNTSAKAQQEKVAFANMAASYGANSKTMIASLKEASGATISTMTLIRSAGTAMMMGIAPDKITELMKIARATSKQTGQTVTKAFEDISLAVGRQSKMILDNLGIIVDVEKANKRYAKELNIVGRQLTDTEKKQAFMNATLAAGNDLMEKLGNQTDTNADKLQRFQAKIDDLKIIVGDGLIRVFNFLDGTLHSVAAASLYVSAGIFKIIESALGLTDTLNITNKAADQWKINTQAAFAAAEDLARKADQAFKDMKTSNEEAINGQKKYKQQIDAVSTSINNQAKAEKKLNDQRKKVVEEAKKKAQEQADATEEMYKEIGIGADGYYKNEASKLVEKAAKWKKHGGDVLAIEDWLYDAIGKLSDKAMEDGEAATAAYMESLQGQSRTLMDQFSAVHQSAVQQIDAITDGVVKLDGTNIGLSVSFDGRAALIGIDNLMTKLQGFKNISAGKVSSSSSESSIKTSSKAPTKTDQGTDNGLRSVDNSTTNFIINQQLSRSDITNITTEQRRKEARN